MTIFLKFLALLATELIKHYTGKIKRTVIDGAGSGKRERRLRDKIRDRWKEKK
jgi:hypothetical protein